MKRYCQDAYAIIMAGGNGERFWPLSTPDRPKQFLDIFGGKTLIRHAVERLRGVIPPERILIITAARFAALTRKSLPEIPAANIVGEPCRRDTAAAVAAATGLVMRLGGPDAVGCVFAADQLISEPAKFRSVLKDAIRVASATDSIVTMGIRPTEPSTAYGYIELGKRLDTKVKTRFAAARRFVEKPDLATARRYLREGRFRWNAGMFIWKASVMAAEFAAAAPDIALLIDQLSKSKSMSAVMRRVYPSLRRISVDYAVMEHSSRIVVAEADFDWDDVGSWPAIARHFAADADGNTCLGATALADTRDSIVVAEKGQRVAVLGLDNVVVVHTAGATLVCARDRVQELKNLIARIPAPAVAAK